MAEKNKIGAKIVLDGENQYRAALKNIKSDQAELRSEMKLCNSTFKENQNSAEALKSKIEILTKQYDIQKTKVDVCSQMVAKSAEAEEKAAKKTEELEKAYTEASQKLVEMTNSADINKEALEEQKKAVEGLKGKLDLAQEGYESTARKTKAFQKELNYANADLGNMQRELNTNNAYLKEAEVSADQCAKSIDKYGKETKEATQQMSVFGDVLKANLLSEAISTGIEKIAEGIKKIAVASVDTGSSFEASMSQVAATMGMTTEEVEGGGKAYSLLADAAKTCGKETMFSATQAGEALNYLALAGYSAEKSAATLPKVLDLAAAGNLDLAYASDLVTDSMAALSMETSQLDNYIDQMARTSQKSNTSVAQLGEASLVCAGTVSLTKQSVETMNAELGILANNGIKGAEGGTHLRNILLSLSAPTDVAAGALQSLGINVSDSSGNMRDLNDILIDLNSSLDGMAAVEKTQIISSIFNKTDITAVNALLKGTGKEFENLTEELRSCDGAAATMAGTLNNNLKGKVTILQSALEGLGISTYEIFDHTMKTAVDSATDAVGKLQKSIDNGDLGVSLNKMSNALEGFIENAIDAGEEVLPAMIDGFTWLLENTDLIVAGVTGIAAANLQMKVVTPAIEATTAAWNAYKLTNEGATISQWLMNAAMSANPAGILMTAVTALTAALAAYAFLNRDSAPIIDDTTRATKDLARESEKLNQVYGSGTESRKAARNNMEAEAAQCKKLVKELGELQKKTSLTSDEQVRQKMIVEQLNQTMPELNLIIDDQTGKLNMSTEALKNNIEAMLKMDKVAAVREDLARIAEEQWEAEKLLMELQEQMAEQNDIVSESVNGNTNAYHQARLAQMDLEEQIEATRGSIAGLTEEYETTAAYFSDTESIKSTTEATGELANAAESAGGQITGMSTAAQEAYAEMYASLVETISGQMSLFDEFNGKVEISSQQLINNMQTQVDGITKWSDNITTLAEKGINQGLLKYLADMGPQGAGYVAAFVEMTDEELKKANELFEQSLILPAETTEKVMEAYNEVGTMAAGSFTTGMEDSKEAVGEAAAGIGTEALERMKEILDINSPSKETQLIGQYFDEGLQTGIKDGEQDVLNVVSNITGEIIRTSQNGLQTKTFHEIGKQITEGLKSGIESGKSGVISAITKMCTDAIKAAKKELDINSPSKKFMYMGEMSGEGYIAGIRNSTKQINAVIESAFPNIKQKEKSGTGNVGYQEISKEVKNINVNQEVNIYSKTDDLIETTRRFRQSQKEAATEW